MAMVGEPGGEVVKTAIDALKGRPEFLALILLNALIFGALLYSQAKASEQKHAEFIQIMQACYNQSGNPR